MFEYFDEFSIIGRIQSEDLFIDRYVDKIMKKEKIEADRIFSKYILRKYGGECYTCGARSQLECGHFITRKISSTRYDERNARPQCIECNRFKSGNRKVFERKLKAELGKEYDKLIETSHKIIQIESQKIINHYKQKLEELDD